MARKEYACDDKGIATEGPCEGHKCDNCSHCRRGICCRRDRPGYKLPRVGDWDGPMYGKLGSLQSNDGGATVMCHVCGEDHINLVVHVNRIHGINAREYKAMFGLGITTGLCSPDFSARCAATARRLGIGGWKEEYLATKEQKRKGMEVSVSLKKQRAAYDLLYERDWTSGKGTCKRGHKLTPDNVGEQHYTKKKMQYYCKQCVNEAGDAKRRAMGVPVCRVLTPEQIEDVRLRFDFGSMGPNGAQALANEYGVSTSTIAYHTRDLREGKTVPEETWQERNRRAREAVKARGRKERCKRGHLLSGDNLYDGTSNRYCKACKNMLQREADARKREL
jgi:hypothetical protein